MIKEDEMNLKERIGKMLNKHCYRVCRVKPHSVTRVLTKDAIADILKATELDAGKIRNIITDWYENDKGSCGEDLNRMELAKVIAQGDIYKEER